MAQKDCVNLLETPKNILGAIKNAKLKGERDSESSIMTLNDNLKNESDEDEKKIIPVPLKRE